MCSSSKDLESVLFTFQMIKLSACQVYRLDFDSDVSHQRQLFKVPILHDLIDGIEGRRDMQHLYVLHEGNSSSDVSNAFGYQTEGTEVIL